MASGTEEPGSVVRSAYRPSMPLRLSRRRLAAAAAAVIAVAIAVLFGAAWYFSNVLEADGLKVDHAQAEFNLTVTTIQRDVAGPPRITLSFDPSDEELSKEVVSYAVWGIEGERAFGQLQSVVASGKGTVTRILTEMDGQFEPGDIARLDRNHIPLFRDSPAPDISASGGEAGQVVLQGPLGELPAWLMRAPGNKWAILIHGRTAGRDETLRAWTSFAQAGYTSLIVTYRNDPETASDPSGYYQFGSTEWADIEPAVQYALDHGAHEVVLAGFSMGGAIAMSFMEHSDLAGHVDGLVLDAPMLDFGRTVDLGAQERHVPGIVSSLAKWLAARRFGVDWDQLNYLSRADELTVPVLLIHGTDDGTVPVETSREMAEMLPGQVRYEEFPDAGHVESWNSDPERYQRVLSEFLQAAVPAQ